MDRRVYLGAMAAGATATALQASAATTERPLGETGVPLQGSEPLPLGPLPGGRYPDPHVESLKAQGRLRTKRVSGLRATMAVERIATGMRWAEGRCISRPAGMYCSATSPTTA